MSQYSVKMDTITTHAHAYISTCNQPPTMLLPGMLSSCFFARFVTEPFWAEESGKPLAAISSRRILAASTGSPLTATKSSRALAAGIFTG